MAENQGGAGKGKLLTEVEVKRSLFRLMKTSTSSSIPEAKSQEGGSTSQVVAGVKKEGDLDMSMLTPTQSLDVWEAQSLKEPEPGESPKARWKRWLSVYKSPPPSLARGDTEEEVEVALGQVPKRPMSLAVTPTPGTPSEQVDDVKDIKSLLGGGTGVVPPRLEIQGMSKAAQDLDRLITKSVRELQHIRLQTGVDVKSYLTLEGACGVGGAGGAEPQGDTRPPQDSLATTVYQLRTQKNVIVHGLPEVDPPQGEAHNENSMRELVKLLGSTEFDYDDAQRLGPWVEGGAGPRPFRIRFVRAKDKRSFLNRRTPAGVYFVDEYADHQFRVGFEAAYQFELQRDPGLDRAIVGNVMYIMKEEEVVKVYRADGQGNAWEDCSFHGVS